MSEGRSRGTGEAPTLTPQQEAAIFSRGTSIVLSAGAGCGKTFVLTQRFLSYLSPEGGVSELSQLVAITFTDRAAREMRSRIRAECRQRLLRCPLDELPHWQKLVRDIDSARVTTFHSFCSAILRANAVEAGIDPRFEPIDELTSLTLKQRAIHEGLNDLLAKQDADTIRVVRDCGLTGTRDRLLALLDERYKLVSGDWDALSPSALGELWLEQWHTRAVPHLYARLASTPVAGQVLELLQRHEPTNATMQERRAVLLSELPGLSRGEASASQLETILEAARVQGAGLAKAWESPEVYEAIKNALAALRDEIEKLTKRIEIDPSLTQATAELSLAMMRVTLRIGTRYDGLKGAAGYLGFDDMLLRARELLVNRPAVRGRIAHGIQLLMVDEFQDTDPIQAEIVRLLCGEALVSGKLFLVGDAKQSIYRFRRADPRVFHQLRQEVPAEGRLPLSKNFRSQPDVLNFVNCLFDGALGDEYEPLDPHARQLTPKPAIEFLFPTGGVSLEETEGDSAEALREIEADWIARRIQQLLHDRKPRVRERNPRTKRDELRPVEPRDVVLLFRAMSNVHLYEKALRHYGIEYYVVGGRAFYSQQEVYDVSNLCSFLDDPHNEVALLGILRSPFFSLSDDLLAALVRTGGSLAQGLWHGGADELDPESAGQVRFAAELLTELRALKDHVPIADLLQHAISRTGYDAAALTEFLGTRKLANLQKLIDQARKCDQAGVSTLADFVESLTAAVQEESKESLAAIHPESANVARLMTVHQSKGLEFPVVFVVDVNRAGKSFHVRQTFHAAYGPIVKMTERFGRKTNSVANDLLAVENDIEEEQESRRLLYVACTRAADMLILSGGFSAEDKTLNAWSRLLSDRFDLRTGAPALDLGTMEPRIAPRFQDRIPEILVHEQPPAIVRDLTVSRTARTPLVQLRELVEQGPVEPLPHTLRRIPLDATGRSEWSVSQLESAIAERGQPDDGASAAIDEGRQGVWLTSEPRLSWAEPSPSASPSTTVSDVPADRRVDGTWSQLDHERLGTLVHAMLAKISFANMPVDLLPVAKSCGLSSRNDVPAEVIARGVQCLERLRAHPLARELGATRSLFREIDFLLPWPLRRAEASHTEGVGSPSIVGAIDCLYERPDGEWEILDFKTGRVTRRTAPRLLFERYAVQLALYHWAATQWLGKPPRQCSLVFLGGVTVERLVWQPDDTTLAEIEHAITQTLHREPATTSSERGA